MTMLMAAGAGEPGDVPTVLRFLCQGFAILTLHYKNDPRWFIDKNRIDAFIARPTT